jgi:hypothetical protein
VPLVLENIASLVTPQDAVSEGDFMSALLERTGCGLLLDVANLYANRRNHGAALSLDEELARWPLHRLVYVHVAGGAERWGKFIDTHAHPVPQGTWELLAAVAQRAQVPGALLERDDDFPDEATLHRELSDLRQVLQTRTVPVSVDRGGAAVSGALDAASRAAPPDGPVEINREAPGPLVHLRAEANRSKGTAPVWIFNKPNSRDVDRPEGASLALTQSRLAQALLRGEGPLAQRDDVKIAARSLLAKRWRLLLNAWPALEATGVDRFAVFAAQQPLNAEACGGRDAAQYADWLAETLPVQLRGERARRLRRQRGTWSARLLQRLALQ